MLPTELNKSASPKRILVVEDDIVAAHAIRMALAVDGHTIEETQDGDEALTKFKAGNYDLVITDFKMPKMDGMELAEAIKKLSPSTPIILLTAYLETIKGNMGKVSNIDVLLGKPISIKALQEALAKVFAAD